MRKSTREPTSETFAQKVLRKLREKHQLPDTPRPTGDPPVLPDDISVLSGDELGRLQGQFAAWANYVEGALATEDVMRLEADDHEDLSLAVSTLEADGPAALRKEAGKADPRTRQAKKASLERRARVKFLTVKLNQFERAQSTLSREQTRREKEMDRRLR